MLSNILTSTRGIGLNYFITKTTEMDVMVEHTGDKLEKSNS